MKQSYNLKITDNAYLGEDHYKMSFKAARVMCQKAKPGQFIEIKCAHTTAPLIRRPFSIYEVDYKLDKISIVYKVVGTATKLLSEKKQNDQVSIIGPLGSGFSISKKTKTHVLAGGGIGIAPLYFLAKTLLLNGFKDIVVLMGASKKEALICRKDFKKLGLNVKTVTDNGTCGNKGSVCDALRRYLKTQAPRKDIAVYTCGPKPMLKVMQNILIRTKINTQVCLEEYMGCGIGVCMGCAVETVDGLYKYVCKDGPVFNMNVVKL